MVDQGFDVKIARRRASARDARRIEGRFAERDRSPGEDGLALSRRVWELGHRRRWVMHTSARPRRSAEGVRDKRHRFREQAAATDVLVAKIKARLDRSARRRPAGLSARSRLGLPTSSPRRTGENGALRIRARRSTVSAVLRGHRHASAGTKRGAGGSTTAPLSEGSCGRHVREAERAAITESTKVCFSKACEPHEA